MIIQRRFAAGAALSLIFYCNVAMYSSVKEAEVLWSRWWRLTDLIIVDA